MNNRDEALSRLYAWIANRTARPTAANGNTPNSA
jgi:hypothetical protein